MHRESTGRVNRLASRAALLLLFLPSASATMADAQESTVDRIRVRVVQAPIDDSAGPVIDVLKARYVPAPGRAYPDRVVISVRPREYESDRFEATIYDYTLEQGFDLLLDGKGAELSRTALAYQPQRSLEERDIAQGIVSATSGWAAGIASGDLEVYEAMPPIIVDDQGRRLVSVGVRSKPAGAGQPLALNEIVSVHIPDGKIVHHAESAPATALATLFACGPGTSGCSYSTGPCTNGSGADIYYHVEWPAVNPLWKLDVRHPTCTDSVQSSGTGLELTKVYYRDVLILERAEMPVLNVKYANDTCGPYRDWLDSEDCFTAVGTDVPSAGSGFRVASAPPSTLCESGSDAGGFRGVAMYDQGNALWLMTETNAGWYRYVMEWKLYLDGTIEPIFGFGATTNSCTCNLHYHHAYWRLEWAPSGTTGNPATGIATLERRVSGTTNTWDPITTEGTFLRPLTNWQNDWFRVRNPSTGVGYTIQPGAVDGQANGDTYGKWDFAGFAYNTGEINDPNSNTSIEVGPWNNGETLGTTKRLVTWYHATYTHNDPGGTGEPCELVGPRLVPIATCAGAISLDRSAYSCSSTAAIVLDDTDLANAGTTTVAVSSNTETTPENVVLTESPAGTGHFAGSIATFTGAPVHGDGKISVTGSDTINVHYVDASSCGTPNVNVDKTAAVDCLAPTITNLQAMNISGTGATIAWDTNESATSIVHYGTTPPGAGSASDTATVTTHGVLITGLSSCTTYYYWVESADPAGNIGSSHSGGGYSSFRTGQNVQSSFAATDTPVSVPDNNSIGATSTITLNDSRIVQDVNVTANITHTYDGDLVLSLITPTNATITLSNRRGGSGDNFTNTTFDDEALVPISSGSPPYNGAFRPESPLSAADNIAATGAWKLKVVDQAALDTGTINSWSLALTFPAQTCPPAGTPPPVPDGSFGQGMHAARTDPSGSIVHLTWDVATCTASNYHLLYGNLASVAVPTVTGGTCGLGPLGAYDWTGVPSGNLWWLVVSDDSAGKEGSWGTTSAGAPIGGTTPSNICGNTARSNTGTCP